MRYIGIIILLVLCLTLLLFTGCMVNTVKPETASGNLGNQEDINQTSNNSQSSSTGLVYEPGTEDTEETGTVTPQKWATGDGTVENPWANDCIQKAYDACPVGGTIFLKAGYYILSGEVAVTKSINIIGEGIDRTIIVTADAHGLYLSEVNYVTLEGFTIDGDAQTDDTGTYGISISGGCNHLLFKDIEVKNAGKYGIDANSVNHSLYQNLYLHDNYTVGIHPGCNEKGWNMYNVYRDMYLYDNGIAGMSDVGNQVLPDEDLYNVYDGIHAWGNGAPGIQIMDQRSGTISNCSASDNGGVGFSLSGLKDFNIHDCSAIGNTYGMYLGENCNNIDVINFSASLNSEHGIKFWRSDNINVDNCLVTLNTKNGIYVDITENINITNVIAKNNNGASSTYGGFAINDSDDITLTSCQSYDDREPLLQAWGITIEGTNTGISLVNCKLSPNAIAEIYNPNGVVLTVITEKKKLSKF